MEIAFRRLAVGAAACAIAALSSVFCRAALAPELRGAAPEVVGAPVAAADVVDPDASQKGYYLEDDPVLGPVEPPPRMPNLLVGRRISFAPGGARLGLTPNGTLSILVGEAERRIPSVYTYFDSRGSNGHMLFIRRADDSRLQDSRSQDIFPLDRFVILLQDGFMIHDWPEAARNRTPDRAWYTAGSRDRPATMESQADGSYKVLNPVTGEWRVLTPFVTYKELFPQD